MNSNLRLVIKKTIDPSHSRGIYYKYCANLQSLISDQLANNCIITERFLLHKRTVNKIKYCVTY